MIQSMHRTEASKLKSTNRPAARIGLPASSREINAKREREREINDKQISYEPETFLQQRDKRRAETLAR